MKRKLNNILLIDDSDSDNFINNRIITKANVTEKITITYGAREALDYLSEPIEGQYPRPEIIFLDINMPDMTGWDFLDEYLTLSDEKKANVVVCMLTTSRLDKDRDKAASYGVVDYYSMKPLTDKKLMEIIEKNFPNNV